MSRYEQSYTGERRTAKVTVQLTPTERQALGEAAAAQGACLSAYAREQLCRQSGAVVAATRRNPEAATLMREINAVGINLNQIARRLNSTGELRDWGELREAIDFTKRAMARLLDL